MKKNLDKRVLATAIPIHHPFRDRRQPRAMSAIAVRLPKKQMVCCPPSCDVRNGTVWWTADREVSDENVKKRSVPMALVKLPLGRVD